MCRKFDAANLGEGSTQVDAKEFDRYSLLLRFGTEPTVSEKYIGSTTPTSESRL